MKDESRILTIDVADSICDASIALSNQTTDVKTDSWHHIKGSVIYEKIVISYLRVLRFIPNSKYYSPIGKFKVWDFSSTASITRSIIEAYFCLFYICIENVSNKEKEKRKLLWLYHEKNERHKMLKIALPNSKYVGKLYDKKERLRKKLVTHTWFLKLKPGRQEELLKKDVSKLDGNIEICKKAGINQNYYQPTFKFLSNFAHTSPFSIYHIDSKYITEKKAKLLFGHIANIASGFSVIALEDYAKLFPEQSLDNSEINEYINIWREIMQWEKSEYFDKSEVDSN